MCICLYQLSRCGGALGDVWEVGGTTEVVERCRITDLHSRLHNSASSGKHLEAERARVRALGAARADLAILHALALELEVVREELHVAALGHVLASHEIVGEEARSVRDRAAAREVRVRRGEALLVVQFLVRLGLRDEIRDEVRLGRLHGHQGAGEREAERRVACCVVVRGRLHRHAAARGLLHRGLHQHHCAGAGSGCLRRGGLFALSPAPRPNPAPRPRIAPPAAIVGGPTDRGPALGRDQGAGP